MPRLAKARQWRFLFSLRTTIFLLSLMGPTHLQGHTISATIQDPSGAVVAEARVEVAGGDLAQPVVLSTDGLGKFVSPDLKPGSYTVRVTRDGFEPLVQAVNLQGSLQLQLTLNVAKLKVSVSVAGKSLAFANADPLYRQLRDVGLGQTFRCDNFTVTWDVGTFQFKHGTFTVLSPVNGVITGAIFIGEGHFNLKPVTGLDVHELSRRTGADEVDEDFSEVIFRFTAEARASAIFQCVPARHHRTAKFQLRTIVAEPDLPSHFSVHGLDPEMVVVRGH
jgi:hypothetical protein